MGVAEQTVGLGSETSLPDPAPAAWGASYNVYQEPQAREMSGEG